MSEHGRGLRKGTLIQQTPVLIIDYPSPDPWLTTIYMVYGCSILTTGRGHGLSSFRSSLYMQCRYAPNDADHHRRSDRHHRIET